MVNYVPHSQQDIKEMMQQVGIGDVEELFLDIPEKYRLRELLDIPPPLSEPELRRHVSELSQKNILPKMSFVGAGSYNHFSPAIVDHIIRRSEFFTAYTPYQPEISQGSLQTIYEFQTMVARLAGMDAASASHYDGSTALAEAAAAACIAGGKTKILISRAVHPHYREVVATYMQARGVTVEEIGLKEGATDEDDLRKKMDETVAGVLVQSPNFFGIIEDQASIGALAKTHNALMVSCVIEGISLGALKSPGELGADIFIGEGQSFGLAQSFGGPYVGLFATKMEHVRKIPGRIVGKSVDADGKDAYVLTLQAREQHIRREKASSNICTNQGLCSIAVAVYLGLVGKKLKDIAFLNMQRAQYAAKVLGQFGRLKFSKPFFNEFVLQVEHAKELHAAMLERGVNPGLLLEDFYPEFKNCLLVCTTELTSKQDIDKLAAKMANMLG